MVKAIRVLIVTAIALASGACAELRNFGGIGDRALDYAMRADTLETQTLRHLVVLAVLTSVAASNVPDDEGSRVSLVYRVAAASKHVGHLRVIALTPCIATNQEGCTDLSARVPEFERVQANLYRSEIAVAADASPEINLGDFVKSLTSGNPLTVFRAIIDASGQFEAIARASTDIFANYRSLKWAKAELYAMLDESKFELAPQKTSILELRNLVQARNINLEALSAITDRLEQSPGFAEKITIENMKSGLAKHAYYPWINITSDACASIITKIDDLKVICQKTRQNLLFAANATSEAAKNFRADYGLEPDKTEVAGQQHQGQNSQGGGATLRLSAPMASDLKNTSK